MLKLNLRSLFLVLGVVILLIVSVGCGRAADNALYDEDDLLHNAEQQNSNIEVSELCMRLSKNMTTENDGNVTLRAEPYIQSPALSWEYSLDIEIKGGKIYINGVLYEESSSIPPVVLYSEGFLAHASYTDEINDTEITNILTKIKNGESCYLLETSQDSKAGQIISVYEIDDFLYFVRFFDNGKVMRIHYAPIA